MNIDNKEEHQSLQTSQQKTVVITGCSSGIGLACCKAALAAGHQVIATARSQTDLAMLTSLGAKAVALELSDEMSINKACEAIRQYSGGTIRSYDWKPSEYSSNFVRRLHH